MSSRFTPIAKLKEYAAHTAADTKPASKPQYDKFPNKLRERVDDDYACAAIAGGFDTLQLVESDMRQHFCLKRGIIYKYPVKESEIQNIGAVYSKVEAANVALLDELLKEEQFPLLNKEAWVELRTSFRNLENPELLQLHMLRRDDFGWAFDAEGGLSVAYVDEFGIHSDDFEDICELRMHVYFVQFMRGSDVTSMIRDPKEEARLREQQKMKPKFKLGLDLRAAAAVTQGPLEKKNPLLEAEMEVERKKREMEEESDAEMDLEEDDGIYGWD